MTDVTDFSGRRYELLDDDAFVFDTLASSDPSDSYRPMESLSPVDPSDPSAELRPTESLSLNDGSTGPNGNLLIAGCEILKIATVDAGFDLAL